MILELEFAKLEFQPKIRTIVMFFLVAIAAFVENATIGYL